jgi:hypothetical protein
MIAGPKVAYDMLVSALFGWGFLSWLSRERGWVSGRIGDWNRGVRGWIIWPGLAALLADCLVNILGSVCAVSAYSGDSNKQKVNLRHNRGIDESEESHEAVQETSSHFWDQVMGSTRPTIPSKVIGLGLVVITLLCPFLVNVAFGKTLVWLETFVAFALALPLGYMAIQATGKTDTTPASALGKLSTVPAATNGILTPIQQRSPSLSLHSLRTSTISHILFLSILLLEQSQRQAPFRRQTSYCTKSLASY